MEAILKEHEDFIAATWEKIVGKISVTANRIQDGMPYTTRDGKYDDCQETDASWWTNSFWSGILWHMYKDTGIETFKQYATSIEAKLDQVLLDYDGLHHDVGFMWLLTSVMNHGLTGDEQARKRAMLAASILSARGNIAGGYIRAWNGNNAGWAIIDCMMNIPLLFWASQQSGDNRFKHLAMMHADKTLRAFIRADGSVNHIVVFDELTGEPLETPAGQGIKSGSSWSRGQSWAVYGFAQAYHWTGKQDYLDAAKRVAHYTLANLALNGYIPLCDYRQPGDSTQLDSSAGAITACGLIEIAKAVPEDEQALYLESALRILKALEEKCAVWDQSDECLLKDGTSQYKQSPGVYEVKNGALIYGDYYYVEAIAKLRELLG